MSASPSTPVKISVVLAVYNGESYIREQLDSLAAQTRPFDELIIRDDLSSDGTLQVVHEWINEHPQYNVRLLKSETNLGFIRNFCELLSAAEGDLIFLCDQDDRWHPDKIERLTQAMLKTDDAKLIASSFEFMNAQGEVYQVPKLPGWSNQNLLKIESPGTDSIFPIPLESIMEHNGFQGCAMVIRKDLAIAYTNDRNFILPHDWQLALLAALRHGLYFYDARLFDYRIHKSNTTSLPQADQAGPLEKMRRVLDYYYRTAPFKDRRNFLLSLSLTKPALWNETLENNMYFYDDYLRAIDARSLHDYHQLMKTEQRSNLTIKDQIAGYLYIFFGHHRKSKITKS